jgi:hypothetical protein
MLMQRTSRRGLGEIVDDPLGIDITGGHTGPIGTDSGDSGTGTSLAKNSTTILVIAVGVGFALMLMAGRR